MSNKLYIGNLSFRTTEEELEDQLSQFGELVSVRIIQDRETRRSKGFGFVEYADAESADKAISALDGQDFGGRQLKVNVAQERPRRS